MQILTIFEMWKKWDFTYFEAVFFRIFAMVYKTNTDMDIKSNMPSVGTIETG